MLLHPNPSFQTIDNHIFTDDKSHAYIFNTRDKYIEMQEEWTKEYHEYDKLAGDERCYSKNEKFGEMKIYSFYTLKTYQLRNIFKKNEILISFYTQHLGFESKMNFFYFFYNIGLKPIIN